jgi:hypothetical protein
MPSAAAATSCYKAYKTFAASNTVGNKTKISEI